MRRECWNCAGDIDGIGCPDCKAGDSPTNWRAGANYVPDSNEDRIRSMSTLEMASFLCAIDWRLGDEPECAEWLRQPAKEI